MHQGRTYTTLAVGKLHLARKGLKKMFIGSLTSVVNASNYTKCVSLNNQQCMTQPTLINLHPSEYSQELHYYPFTVNLDRCVRSCKTLDDQ